MKYLFYCLILFCVALMQTSCDTNKHTSSSSSSSSDDDNDNESYVFSHPYVYPSYLNGGVEGLLSDLYTALSKTTPMTQECVKGRAVVSFTISKDGTIKPNSIKIIRNLSVPDDYMNAAIEAIKGLGKFESGKFNGEAKNVNYLLSIIYPIPLDRIKTSE